MKKLSCILLTLALLLAMAACGDETASTPASSPAPSAAPAQTEAPAEAPAASGGAVTGETYDTGNFTALVPEGWKAFPQHDVFSDDPDEMNPNLLQISKGASSDMDLFSKPVITITYAGPSTKLMAPSRDFYDDVEAMDDVTTGEHTWEAFRCTSFGQKMVMLFEDLGKLQFQAAVAYETSDGKIDFNDADVQAILASIAPSKAEDIAAAAEGGEAAAAAQPDSEPESGAEEAATDSGESEALSQLRGDWNGAFAFRNCTGNFESLEGYEQAAIARFSVDIIDTLRPFVGICVETCPLKTCRSAIPPRRAAICSAVDGTTSILRMCPSPLPTAPSA